VNQGQTQDLEVTLDATLLPRDLYEAEIVILNSAGDPVVVPVTLTVSAGPSAVPAGPPPALNLAANYPNPFNPRTTIAFDLPHSCGVRLAVFTPEGKRVATLVNRSLPAGRHRVFWNGSDDSGRAVASGVYFYRLEADGRTLSGKMVLVR